MILFCREITHNRVEKACSREMVISAGVLNNRIIKRLVNSLYHEARKSFYILANETPFAFPRRQTGGGLRPRSSLSSKCQVSVSLGEGPLSSEPRRMPATQIADLPWDFPISYFQMRTHGRSAFAGRARSHLKSTWRTGTSQTWRSPQRVWGFRCHNRNLLSP